MPASLLDEVRRIADTDGTTVNQFINLAVAEKAAALRTASYFAERRQGANLRAFDRLLAKAGKEAPRPGDERDAPTPRGAARRRR